MNTATDMMTDITDTTTPSLPRPIGTLTATGMSRPFMPTRTGRIFTIDTVTVPPNKNRKPLERAVFNRISSNFLYSTVTDFARFLGWSTGQPRMTAM